MKIADIMTLDVVVANPDHHISAIAELMADRDIGFVLVGENDQLVGTVTDRDIVVRGLARGHDGNAQVRDVMTPDVKYCFEDQTVEEVMRNMGEVQVRRMPVVSRDKQLVGVVTVGDVAAGESAEKAGEALSGISRPGGSHHQ